MNFDDEIELSDCGWIHEDDLPDLDFAKSMLISVINAVYETGDLENFEDCLDELATTFNLRLPQKKLMIQKRNRKPYQIQIAI